MEALVVKLGATRKEKALEIHQPPEFAPRFYERVSTLSISRAELREWVARYARRQPG